MKSDRLALLVFATVALSACGGSDSNAPPATPTDAQGLWIGTLSTNQAVSMLVLDNGEIWGIYSAVGQPGVVDGAFQGTANGTNGTFSASGVRVFDIGFGTINDGNIVSTNFVHKSVLDGAANYTTTSGSLTFNTTYAVSYDLAPSIAAVAGTYLGTAAVVGGEEQATVTIDGAGAISGSSASGCSYHGNATAHAAGNVYDLTVTFEGAPCANGTTTVTGVAYVDEAIHRLYSAALNSGRTNGFLFIGDLSS